MNDHKSASSQIADDEPVREISSVERARRIILAHGWNSTSYQIINPGIEHWFARKYEAVVGFVACRGVRVVAGAPVCANESLSEVAAEFENDAAQTGERVCYFCAEARLESIYSDSLSHSKILLGAQPIWQPKNWAEIVRRHKSLRAQLNRARNKGVTISEWSTEKASNNPTLIECLGEWLAAKACRRCAFWSNRTRWRGFSTAAFSLPKGAIKFSDLSYYRPSKRATAGCSSSSFTDRARRTGQSN